MKILILTTKTDHHLFFCKEIKKKYNNVFTILEKKKKKFDFKTNHKYFKERLKFEKNFFFKNKKENFTTDKSFFDINSKNSINYIKKINPDIIILFGIGLVKKKFLNLFIQKKIINLHGGDPENYRGLDSILWSLYHKDYKGLVTTLHNVDKRYDTGDIIFKKKIKLNNKSLIQSIRAINTQNCVYLFLKFLKCIEKKNKITYIKQKKVGRYYSAIPASLIDISIKNFMKMRKNEKL